MKIIYILLLASLLIPLFAYQSLSQAISVKIHVEMDYYNIEVFDSVSVFFGFDKSAQDCITLKGGEFGETEAPPFGNGFEFRFMNPNPPTGDDTCYGQGSYNDYRHWGDSIKIDTFKTGGWFAAGPSGILKWSWPTGLGKYFTSLILKDAVGGSVMFDMLTIDSVSTNLHSMDWYIIATPIVSDVPSQNNSLPGEFILHQNYPNPFNPQTTISYEIPERDFVRLKVYDVLGQEVASLVNEIKPAGKYEAAFDGSKLSSGVYFFQLRSGLHTSTKPMMYVK